MSERSIAITTTDADTIATVADTAATTDDDADNADNNDDADNNNDEWMRRVNVPSECAE